MYKITRHRDLWVVRSPYGVLNSEGEFAVTDSLGCTMVMRTKGVNYQLNEQEQATLLNLNTILSAVLLANAT